MNMKKTIAAIAAGAVAVSAMATTVSALEAKTLTYNLVRTQKLNAAEGKITANFTAVPLTDGGHVTIYALGATYDGAYKVTVTGSYWDDYAGSNKSFAPVVATKDKGKEGWSYEGENLVKDNVVFEYGDGKKVNSGVVKIPVRANAGVGTNVGLVASSKASITVTIEYWDLPSSVGSNTDLNNLINSRDRGVYLQAWKTDAESGSTGLNASIADTAVGIWEHNSGDAVKFAQAAGLTEGTWVSWDPANAIWTVGGSAGGVKNVTFTAANGGANVGNGATVKNGDIVDVASSAANNTVGDSAAGIKVSNLKDGHYVLTCDTTGGVAGTALWTLTMGTDTIGTAKSIKGASTATTDGDPVIVLVDSTDTAVAAVVGDKIEFDVVGGVPAKDVTTLVNTYFNVNYSALAMPGPVGDGYGFWLNVEEGSAGGGMDYDSSISGSALETKAAGIVEYPFKTTLTGSTDVITNVYTKDQWTTLSDGVQETIKVNADAIRSVINDAVVNYADVTFVFNTAAKKVVLPESTWGNPVGSYVDNDWDADKVGDFTQFSRHWWDSDPGYDANTQYIYSDWLGNNLFEGALIINRDLTLSLGATDKFDWTSTSLSFSWDAIQDTALTNNAYANYIHNMILRTSADWYWDNFQIVLGATEDEDVGTTSPVEAEEEELEESEPEVEAEPEEEPEEEPEVEAEPEPEVAPAANPGTGNAPVALAVIPVALAAAAIVAKKRG